MKPRHSVIDINLFLSIELIDPIEERRTNSDKPMKILNFSPFSISLFFNFLTNFNSYNY